MKLTLLRHLHRADYIEGSLSTQSGQHMCHTLENGIRHLPQGEYRIHIAKCHQHGRKMPIILRTDQPACGVCQRLQTVWYNTNMPTCCPQICPGNGAYHRTDNAVLVGELHCHGCLTQTKAAFDRLYETLRKQYERNQELYLVIRSKGNENKNDNGR